jgi:hypothetical protein
MIWTAVPKAPVDEHRHLGASEDNVGLPPVEAKRSLVDTIAEALSV